MPGPEPIQIEHLSSLSFYDDNFVYKNKSYSFDDVVHVKFTATRTQHSVNFVPTGTSFETDLRVVLVAGPVLRITPDRGFLQKEARFEAILRAAEILSEITFTKRMENYESELAEHNFLTWDGDCQSRCRGLRGCPGWGGTEMEMELTFKPGDVVQLNSGGPRMTVVAVQSDGTLRCVWFHEDGKQDNGVFAQVALRAAKTKN